MLVTGISATAFDTIDQGARRTGADIFALCGVSNASTISASMTILYQHKNDITLGTPGGTYGPDMDERIALFDNLSGYEHLARDVCQHRSSLAGVFPQPKMLGLYYLFQKKHRTGARCFLNAFVSDDADRRNPASVVRQLFLKFRVQDFKLGGQSECAYMKLAWNAFAAGEQVEEITLPGSLDIPIDPLTSQNWIDNF